RRCDAGDRRAATWRPRLPQAGRWRTTRGPLDVRDDPSQPDRPVGLSGFYLSLAPGLIASIQWSSNLLWGGAAVFCMCFSGGDAIIVLRQATAQTAMLIGCSGP